MDRSTTSGRLTLALDLEGTLISNAISLFPRPGLFDFLEWAQGAFGRIVLFTSVPPDRVHRIVSVLAGEGSAPSWIANLEIVEWSGAIKDLRFVPGAAPEQVFLVDDQEAYVHPDQTDRWVRVSEWEHPYPEDDDGLAELRSDLERRLLDDDQS